jgi:hypothetical protein
MSSIEFFFDPMCPFAWITSRWVHEVADQRDVEVRWNFISLAVINEQKFADDDAAIARGEEPAMPMQYRDLTAAGASLLRVAAALRDAHDNEAVGDFYTTAGALLHDGGRTRDLWKGGDPQAVVSEVIAAAEVDPAVLDTLDDPRWDKIVRAESDLAIARTGEDVGTPIITWDTTRPAEASMFGPVLSRIPRGEEAVRLWDAVEVVARTPGFSELKRSLRADLSFA